MAEAVGKPLVSGRGYWIYMREAKTISVPEVKAGPDSAFKVKLEPGWNIIGNPYEYPLDPAVSLRISGAAFQDSKKVIPVLLTYDGDSGTYRYAQILEQWKGYCVYANEAAELEIIPAIYEGPVPDMPDLYVFPFNGGAQIADAGNGVKYVAGQLIAAFGSGITYEEASRVAREAGLSVAGGDRDAGVYQLQIPPGMNAEAAESALAAAGGVIEVAKNYLFKVQAVPNDPVFTVPPVAGAGWGFEKIGMPGLWAEFAPKNAPVVAALDTGVDKTHPELAGRVLEGRNFVNSSAGADTSDENGHGTQVAGVIAAAGNNSAGMAGVCWNCRILPVKVCDASGQCPMMSIMNGISYAADMKAPIINLGIGGDMPLDDAAKAIIRIYVKLARSKGSIIVAPAGNSSTDNFGTLTGTDSGVVNVAATDANDNRATFSNYGGMVNVAAPGENIYTTDMNGGYKTVSGTSMSAAFVSGAAALLISAGDNLTVANAIDLIAVTVDPVSSNEPIGGRLNVSLAMKYYRHYTNKAPEIVNVEVMPGATNKSYTLKANVTDQDGDAITYKWAAGSGVFSAGAAQKTWTLDKEIKGVYTITLTATDAFGGSAESRVGVNVSGTDPAQLTVKVIDANGVAVTGAMAEVGGSGTFTTGADGRFSVNAGAADGVYAIKIKIIKEGFVDKFATFRVLAGSLENGTQNMTVELERTPTGSGAARGLIVHADGTTDTALPSNGSAAATVTVGATDRAVEFITPEVGGEPAKVGIKFGDETGAGPGAAATLGVTGQVTASIIYGDPTSESDILRMFPGEFLTNGDTGFGGSGEGALVTGGFARIDLTDAAGAPIKNFAAGAEALVTMRMPFGVQNPETGKMAAQGDTIPILFYDENAGEWIVEHEAAGSVKRAEIQQDADGMFVQFKVAHLTTWNLDWKSMLCPEGQPTIKLYDMNGISLAGQSVYVTINISGWNSWPNIVTDGFVSFPRAPKDIDWQLWAQWNGYTSKVMTVKNCVVEENLQVGPCDMKCGNDAACSDGNNMTYDVCMRPGQCTASCVNMQCAPVCNSDASCDDGKPTTTDTCRNAGACGAYCSHVSCNVGCGSDANCEDGDPDTLDVCLLPGTCNATCKKYDVHCDVQLDKVNYFAGDEMQITLTAVNKGPAAVTCGVESALKREQSIAVWNSFDDGIYITIAPGDSVTQTIYKTIPDTWVATDSNAGSDYDLYTVREDGTRWDGRDNFNIHVHKPCVVACKTDAECADTNQNTYDVCKAPYQCFSACNHLTCPVACASDYGCDDGNSATTDSCANPKTCDAKCFNGSCAIKCTTNAGCDDGNPMTADLCSQPGTCSSACVNANCTPVCSNDSQCDDTDPLTRDTCENIGSCEATCAHTACAPACELDSECDDTDPLTIDSCLNPNTCNAACTHVACSPICSADGDCDDNNLQTLDTCKNPNTCAAECENSACTPQCTQNSDCNDNNALTPVDECVNPNTCAAECKNCTPFCVNDVKCDDFNLATRDKCENPNTCSATCSNTTCTPACVNNAGCDDDNAATADECSAPNTCEALCKNVVPACNNNADCNDNNPGTADICLFPGKFSAKCSNTYNSVFVSTAKNSSCYIDGGTVKCWGSNGYGQLGDGTTNYSATLVTVSGITNATALTSGTDHTCALLSDGGVKCWGINDYGTLGNGTGIDSSVPVSVTDMMNVVSVSAGGSSACAVMRDGWLKCWGYNKNGELGDGTTKNAFVPTTVVGITNAISVSVGSGFACALLNSGGVKCWGDNAFGTLGNGTPVNSLLPVAVSGITNAVSVSAGNKQACALLSGGSVMCWGMTIVDGQLNIVETPIEMPGVTNASAVSVGSFYVCAVISGGSMKCWGGNTEGQLGSGSVSTMLPPAPVPVLNVSDAVSISASVYHTCAFLASGNVKCWGNNDYGKLGNGTTVSSATPVDVTACLTDVHCDDGNSQTTDVCNKPGQPDAYCTH
ncbi:MAG: S8 family serine peptidase [bacterium]